MATGFRGERQETDSKNSNDQYVRSIFHLEHKFSGTFEFWVCFGFCASNFPVYPG